MAMTYVYTAIPDSAIPRASSPVFQHALDTYASETNKVVSVWREFSSDDMSFRPHPRSSTVRDIFNHQLLSERRFFGEFLGLLEPPASEIQPKHQTPESYAERLAELVLGRSLPSVSRWPEPLCCYCTRAATSRSPSFRRSSSACWRCCRYSATCTGRKLSTESRATRGSRFIRP